MGATDHIPRVPLGFLPTPVERLARLGDRLGIDLWLERDDYTGFGGGGNKVRKLEFLMAEALAQGATLLVTTGGHQSNHARIVAAAVCRFGMRSILVLRGEAPAEYQGNLLLDRLFGAELDFLPWDDYPALVDARMQAHADRARAAGRPDVVVLASGSGGTQAGELDW